MRVSCGKHLCRVCGQHYDTSVVGHRRTVCSSECGLIAHKAYQFSQRSLRLRRYAERKSTQTKRTVNCMMCSKPFHTKTKAKICGPMCSRVYQKKYQKKYFKTKKGPKLSAMNSMSNLAKLVEVAKILKNCLHPQPEISK